MPVGQPAGQRRRPMTLQEGTPLTSPEGDAIMSWQDIAYLHGQLSPMTVQEQLLAAQRGEEATHVVTTVWRPNFPAPGQLRLVMGNRIFFVIGAVDPDELHRQLVLHCREFVTSEQGAT